MAAVCGFALSCWNTQGLPWNRHHQEGSICCSKTFIYLSAFIVPSKTWKLPIPYALPYPKRCWLLNWMLITRWKVSLFFSQEDMASVISNKNVKFGFGLIIEHFYTLKQSILNEPWPTGHDSTSGPCSQMASFLHDRAFSWHLQMARWIVFTNSGFWKYSWAHLVVNDRIMPMSDAVSSEGLKTTCIQQKSSALSLTHRDFSSFSESLDDVMDCRLWDLQTLCNLKLKNIVFKAFHNIFTLRHSFYITDLMSINLISC